MGDEPTAIIQPAVENGASNPFSLAGILDNNPYFSAGFGLMGLGVALTVLRKSSTMGLTLLQRRLLVSLEISSKDPAFPWFLEFISSRAKQRPAHTLSLETRFTQPTARAREQPEGPVDVKFSFLPGHGTHWLSYKGALMRIERERNAKMTDLMSGKPFETVSVTTLSRYRHLLPSMLAEARDLAERDLAGKLVVYTAWGVEWKEFGAPRTRRHIKSVVLADGVAERIETDLKAFLARKQWYFDRGIPYRRGYLLHGTPGSGKTSFIQALAGHLSYNICVLDLSQRGLMDDKLNHLLLNAPERSFILLEDIDAAFNKRIQTSEDGYQSGVTFAGLLNALDGVASSTEERIVFMTTNHLERLDAALIRPGRVDLLEEVGPPTGEQARRLSERFFAGERDEGSTTRKLGEELETRLATNTPSRVSMASLQGHFIRHPNASSALRNLDELIPASTSGA